jgi:hypothetical protein
MIAATGVGGKVDLSDERESRISCPATMAAQKSLRKRRFC